MRILVVAQHGNYPSIQFQKTPAPAKRKITAKTPAAATPLPASKKARISTGALAISSLSTDVKGLSTALQNFLAPPPASSSELERTPLRKQRAIIRAQELEKSWLSTRQLVAFVSVLSSSTDAVDTYTVLVDDLARKCWVRDRLPEPLQRGLQIDGVDDEFLDF